MTSNPTQLYLAKLFTNGFTDAEKALPTRRLSMNFRRRPSIVTDKGGNPRELLNDIMPSPSLSPTRKPS